jgi:hypothetical protein
MFWNIRIVHIDEGYGVYEVFYNDDGTPWGRDMDAMLYGETLEELYEYIDMMLEDIGRQAILEDKDINPNCEKI